MACKPVGELPQEPPEPVGGRRLQTQIVPSDTVGLSIIRLAGAPLRLGDSLFARFDLGFGFGKDFPDRH
jgi:hypothetical protein